MNRALLLLLGLQGKAMFRRMTRGLRSVKGALLCVFGLGMIGLWILPSIQLGRRHPRTDAQAEGCVARSARRRGIQVTRRDRARCAARRAT